MDLLINQERTPFHKTQFTAFKDVMERKKFFAKKEKTEHQTDLLWRELIALTILRELKAEFATASRADGALWHRKPKMVSFLAQLTANSSLLRSGVKEVPFIVYDLSFFKVINNKKKWLDRNCAG